MKRIGNVLGVVFACLLLAAISGCGTVRVGSNNVNANLWENATAFDRTMAHLAPRDAAHPDSTPGMTEQEVAGVIGKAVHKRYAAMLDIPNTRPIPPAAVGSILCPTALAPCRVETPLPVHYRLYITPYEHLPHDFQFSLKKGEIRFLDKGTNLTYLFVFEDEHLIAAEPFDGSKFVNTEDEKDWGGIIPYAGAGIAGGVVGGALGRLL